MFLKPELVSVLREGKPGDMACQHEAVTEHMPGVGLLLTTISFLDVLAFFCRTTSHEPVMTISE
jgi:hypothetical protein